RLLAVLIAGIVVVGCQSSEPTGEQAATGIENARLRTDREPIQKRFPQLGAFSEVYWLGGRLGDSVARALLVPDQQRAAAAGAAT
ncbi:MAG TPA: hypothetical protein VNO83_08380, partial [Pseudonocardia sp.]|nr:hypothetical protein [Pseudonocardia sp.]